jgi:cytochrome c
MSSVRSIVIACIVALSVSGLCARAHPFGDPGLYAQSRNGAIMQHDDIPSNIRETLTAKCADCHSTQTRAPLYGRFAPFSWLMERDIVEGREAMNLSQWEKYSSEEQEAFKSRIVFETSSHRMPLPQYRIIHWSSRITDSDIGALNLWARQSPDHTGSQAMPSVSEADAAHGKEAFERRCTGCHSLDQNREGPRLRSVFGRTAGSVSDFDYSSAIKNSQIIWNERSLESWLTDPDILVPGNNMDFHVANPQERRDLVRFLKESSDK